MLNYSTGAPNDVRPWSHTVRSEGQDAGLAARHSVGYPAGASAYFRYIDDWRRSGRFEGLAFR